MSRSCQTCGTEGDPANPIRALEPLGREQDETAKLLLCSDCLDQRRTGSWPVGSDEHDRLADAIDDHGPPTGKRFSYIEGEEGTHLVRLDQDWVREHETDG